MFRVLLLVLLLTPLCNAAESIYRTTDAEGNVVFTDAPSASDAGSTERVKIQPINTVAPPSPLTAPITTPREPEETAISVTITSPEDETSFPMGPGNFSASVRVEPQMSPRANLQLFVDGAPWGTPQRSANWRLTNVFRGEHDLTVGLIDGSGETVAMSEPIRVYVHRPSVNFKNRAN